MDDLRSLSRDCPACGGPIDVTYRHIQDLVDLDAASQFICPWCGRQAVLYLPGWIIGLVMRRES